MRRTAARGAASRRRLAAQPGSCAPLVRATDACRFGRKAACARRGRSHRSAGRRAVDRDRCGAFTLSPRTAAPGDSPRPGRGPLVLRRTPGPSRGNTRGALAGPARALCRRDLPSGALGLACHGRLARGKAREASARYLGALALPGLFAYSCLYWDHEVRFIAWTARPPQHGPVFWAAAVYGWTLVTGGTVLFLIAARRRARVSSLQLGVDCRRSLHPTLRTHRLSCDGRGFGRSDPDLCGPRLPHPSTHRLRLRPRCRSCRWRGAT